MIAAKLEFLTSGRETKRFHTVPVLSEQNIAAHSFGVAMLVGILVPKEELRAELLMAALTHDLAEQRMGADMAAPAKRSMPDYARGTFREVWGAMEEDHLVAVGLGYFGELYPEEERILKLADATEGALFCIRERAMGNKLVVTCYSNFRRYISQVAELNDRESDLIGYIDDMWEQANGG